MWLLSAILYLILTIVVIFIVKDIIPYIKYKLYYAKQGIPYHYVPIAGSPGLLLDFNSKDVYGRFKTTLAEKYKDNKIVAINEMDKTCVSLFINDVDLFKEYLIKENDYSKRINFTTMPFSLGFFEENGQKALVHRAIFNEFFRPENLKYNTPKIGEIIKKKFLKLKEKLWGDQKSRFEFKEYNMKDFTPDLFSDVVNEILFGSDDYPIIEGMKLPDATDKLMSGFVRLLGDPLHLITFGLLHQYGIHPHSGEINRKGKVIMEEILKVINRRKLKKDSELGVNMIDLMIKYNRTCPENERLSDDMMISNTILFLVAGVDTTKSSTESFMKIMSEKTEIIDKIQNVEIPKIFKEKSDWSLYENYEKSSYFNQIIDEFMRMYGPAGVTFSRRVTKNFKLGKYQIRKGDLIIVPILPLQFNEKNFTNPKEFESERFNEENKKKIKRLSYIPFYEGKRACIGKYLAELVLRMIMSHFLDMFEMKGNGEEYEIGFTFTQVVKDAKILIKPRCVSD